MQANSTLTPQEKRVFENTEELLTSEKARKSRPKVNRLLKGFRSKPPRVAVERGRLFTKSFKETEGYPVVWRWARALEKIMNEIEIEIGDDEIIVGRCGPKGRYGLLYPELRGAWLEKGIESLPNRKEGKFVFSEEDASIIKTEILPYWKGKTLFEVQYNLLPEDTRKLLYEENDPYTPSYILIETSTERHSLQWVLDYNKVLKHGFCSIKKDAEDKIAILSPFDNKNNFQKYTFLNSVIITCNAIMNYSNRYSRLASDLAAKETNCERRQELIQISKACSQVPGFPARNFYEAVQSMWFAQVAFRFEQFLGGGVGNGRIDQILYPYFQKDMVEKTIDERRALEILENFWIKIAQSVTFRQAGNIAHREGLPHFEATTIGGQDKEGRDATNELTFLILKSKKEFPLDFPDLAVRIHSRTPERLLYAISELIKEGTGFPKLINDEEVIPSLLSKGAELAEARDYAVSGCTEVRMPNRDTYLTGNCQINLAAALEMALNDGKLSLKGNRQFGLATGNAKEFTFEELMNAFKSQVEYITMHAFIQNQVIDSIRPSYLASPLLSSLHDLCMDNCVDIQQGIIAGGISLGSWDPVGFGTVVDSLVCLKELVYEKREVPIGDMLKALECNFNGYEIIHQKCLNARKFGNNDYYADNIARELDDFFRSISHKYNTLYGGKLDLRYVPVTAHVPLGRIVAATPNGRKSMEPLSEGISPTQGADIMGPTSTFLSIAKSKNSVYKEGAARLFNIKLSPQAVAGSEGTKRLVSLIRSWCDLKIWHLQFNIINARTLCAALVTPEKYRNLMVRVAGYSAYFVDLSTELKKEIIMRTEHTNI